ncbi:phospholipid scramblase-related protein [Nocardia anaemiae]|uniref:phospholipid scramblase-related protein n=1 Tax=Nocardia anaemiae TaxID=263910 RepID=UPI0007A53625|nr:phospholipid scramblase-related protein [Nocardia anaemiae]
MLIIDQQPKLVEINTEYALLDRHGRRLGAVVQVGQSRLKKFARFFGDFSNFFTHQLEVRDASENLLLSLVRPRKVFKSRVVVEGSAGQSIGLIIQENWWGAKRFAMLVDGERVGTIHADGLLGPRIFSIVDAGGGEIARITRTTQGLHRAITSAEKYVVEIHDHLREPIASLVLASALSINTALMQVKSTTVGDLVTVIP